MKAAVPCIRGAVDGAGKLVLSKAELRRMQGWLATLRARDVEVVVRPQVRRKTVPQMAYLHAEGGPFPVLAEFFGMSLADIKPALAGACWGWQKDPISGREIPINGSVGEWTREQASHFIDWVLPWASTEYRVYIEPPEAFTL